MCHDARAIAIGALVLDVATMERLFWEKAITTIAREQGISASAVRTAFLAAGLKERVQASLEGCSRGELAARIGINREVLASRLESLGIPRTRTRGRWAFLAVDDQGNPLPRGGGEARAKVLLDQWGYGSTDVLSWNRLKKDGHGDFVSAANRHGLGLEKIASLLGATVNKNHEKFQDLDRDENGILLPRKRRLQSWSKFLHDTVFTEAYRAKHGLPPGTIPPRSLLARTHGDVAAALNNRHITQADLASVAGLRLNKETGKWNDFRQDATGTLLPRKQRIQKWATYFSSAVFTAGFKARHDIQTMSMPTIDIVEKEHADAISAMHKSDVCWNEVALQLGLETNHVPGKWRRFDVNDDGRPRTHAEQVAMFSAELRDAVVTDSFRTAHGTGEGEMPSQDELERAGHGDIVRAMSTRNVSLLAVAKHLGWNPRRGERWLDRLGEIEIALPDHQGTMDILVKHVIENIMVPSFTRAHGLRSKVAPSIELLRRAGHGGFVSFCYRENVSTREIFERAGLLVSGKDEMIDLGNLFHDVIEDIVMTHAIEQGCTAGHEVHFWTGQEENDKSRRKCDVVFLVDHAFTSLSPLLANFCKDNPTITLVVLDFFLGCSEEYTRSHCLRGYQDKDRGLICIPSHCVAPRSPPDAIPFTDHVLVLDPGSFPVIFGLTGDITREFTACVELVRRAAWDETSFDILKARARNGRDRLRTKHRTTQRVMAAMLAREHARGI